MLEQGGVVLLGDNKTCKVYGVGTTSLKIFTDHEFLLHNMMYVRKLKRNLLFISMFHDLGYCTRVEHDVLKISHGEVIIAKWYKIYDLYILEDSNVVFHSSLPSENFHDNNKL